MTAIEQGQKHRELVARKSRERSKSVREIAPLPPLVNPQRRMKARRNLRYFCEQYFPNKFKLNWASFHLEIIKRFEESLIQGSGRTALACPRGSGKTTLVETAVIWALLYGHCRYVFAIGANKPESKKMLDNIKASLSENDALLEDFPESIYPFRKLNGAAMLARGQLYMGESTRIEWKPDSVTFAKIPGSLSSGATAVCAGINQNIRGKNKTMPDGSIARPQAIILDDLQGDKAARSPNQIEHLEKTIDKTIEGLVDPASELCIMMCCTVIEEGDLSDRYLNKEIKKQWKGLRFKAVEQMPHRMDLWNKYKELRDEDAVSATMFYKEHRSEMKEGAVVSWEDNYSGNAIDALQYMMNKYCDNPLGFYCEYQNEPFNEKAGTAAVSDKTVRSRTNGLPHLAVPADTYKTTAFIDCHDDLLYYAVAAFDDSFKGSIIDYCTFPEQTRKYYKKGDTGLLTLKTEFGGKKDGNLAKGLEMLLGMLLAEKYPVDGESGEEFLGIDKILVDSGYATDVIQEVLQKAGNTAIVRPSKGEGIGAKKMPLSEYRQRPKEDLHLGHYWLENRSESRKFRRIRFDTNYWKTYVHTAFDLNPAESGSLSLWGNSGEKHRMFSEHITAEKVQLVEASGRKVYEWETKPGKPDNHFFDCVVGCAVAASVCGIKTENEKKTIIRQHTQVFNL